jgi:NTE family protein
MKQQRIGLALGGGGARGLAHIAFLETLDSMGIKPDIITGTSMGAVIGSFYAAGIPAREIREKLRLIRLRELRSYMDLRPLSSKALMRGKGFEDFMHRYLPVKSFEKLRIPLLVMATDFWKREEVVLSRGEIVRAVRASVTLPALMEPVIMNDRVLIDGGAVNPVPWRIIRDRCDILIAIDVSGRMNPPEKGDLLPNMFESLFNTFQIMQSSIIRNMLDHSSIDIYCKPDLSDIRMLEFHRYEEIFSKSAPECSRMRDELVKKIRPGGSFKKRQKIQKNF